MLITLQRIQLPRATGVLARTYIPERRNVNCRYLPRTINWKPKALSFVPALDDTGGLLSLLWHAAI